MLGGAPTKAAANPSEPALGSADGRGLSWLAMRTVRLRITGRVQGVGYRAWAVRAAAALGLRGWIRNRVDGTVELLATGAEDAVAAMIDATRHGPAGARVGEVDVVEEQDDSSVGFATRPTE